MKYSDTVILVFAKAPVAGKVNTRLIPDIGVQAATRLQQDFIYQRLTMLTQADLCPVALMCAPDANHECFEQCHQQYKITLLEQSGNDLGARLHNGIQQALQNYKYCIVIGTDAPALNAAIIKEAIDVLHTNKNVVFVPAEDGGYVLLGVDKAYTFLFDDIPWGSADVMQKSRDAIIENNIAYTELAECWDVDRVEDYRRYLALR